MSDFDEDTKSCLYRKITKYVDLDDYNARYLEKLEDPQELFPARRRLRRAGETATQLYIVRRGWLYSVRYLAGDRRHVQGLHFPGDVIGLGDVTLEAASADLITATDVVLCPVPKENLPHMFVEAPRIAAILFSFAALDSIILSERLAVVSRLQAEGRIAHLLMQIHARLAVTSPGNGNWIRMPISQEIIGDAVSLTQAYVNRSLKALEDRGLIQRRNQGVELLDLAALTELGEFEDRFQTIDTKWFPK